MLKYIIKRILIFIPMLIAISLIAFVISINAPGDPIQRMTKSDQEGGADANAGSNEDEKNELREKYGLNLPIFYFSISDVATPKNLHNIKNISEKENLQALINNYGNWESINKYYKSVKTTEKKNQSINLEKIIEKDSTLDKNKITEQYNAIGVSLKKLLDEHKINIIDSNILILENHILTNTHFEHLKEDLQDIIKRKENLELKSQKWKTYIPWINYYGSSNQYHLWLFGNGKDRFGIFRGDFGVSYNDGQEITEKIWDRLGISFALSIISILIAYFISIPLGIFSAYKKDSFADRSISLMLFILYSLPSFFIGTLLLLWFSNTNNLYWFPESGIQNPITWNAEWEWWEWEAIKHRFPYLVLPLITYTYGSFAFLSRIMRIGMIDVVGQDYIRTARAKGLSERIVILKHALRNSLLPIITVFAAVFPLAVGGSIIIEVIFTIPGMGLEMFIAIKNQDYPMIIAFFTMAGFLTMVGYLVSDILYAVVDPRISYK